MAISLEHQIRNILEGRSKGTLEREKVQNVARPNAEPSKHAKTEEIQKKIIDEADVPTPSAGELAKKWRMSLSAVKKRIEDGEEVEKEHTTDSDKAAEIASDHLKERPDYYKKLAKMERTPVKEENIEEARSKEGYQNWPGEKKKKFFNGPRDKDGQTETQKWAKKRAAERSSIIDKNPKTKDTKPDDFVAEEGVFDSVKRFLGFGPTGQQRQAAAAAAAKKMRDSRTGSTNYTLSAPNPDGTGGQSSGAMSPGGRVEPGSYADTILRKGRGLTPNVPSQADSSAPKTSDAPKTTPPGWGLRSAVSSDTTSKSSVGPTTTPKGIGGLGMSSAQAAPLPPKRPEADTLTPPKDNAGDTYADGRNKSAFQAAYDKARELGGSKAQFDFGGKQYQAAADKSEYVPTSQQKRVDVGDSKNPVNHTPDTAEKAGAPPKRPTDLNTESGKGKKKMSEEVDNKLISAFFKLQGMVNENRFEAVKKLEEKDVSGEVAFQSPQSRRDAKHTYSKPAFKYKEKEKDVYGVIGSPEREKAMAATKKKSVKEETQLDELSDEKLRAYKKKAGASYDAAAWSSTSGNAVSDKEANRTVSKRSAGIKAANSRLYKEGVSFSETELAHIKQVMDEE